MSLVGADLTEFEQADPDLRTGHPPAEFHFAPASAEEAASILESASDARLPVLLWGGGTHQAIGHPVEPRVVVSTAAMKELVAWEPDDLTVVAEAGMKVADLETLLGSRRQTAALPEVGGEATVGGVVAAGISGYRRARYGPTRDRMLEVSLVTGDGRVVRGGGRVVKNVTGFDLPRLAAGSLGSLGLITSVCLKLWPLPESSATVRVADPGRAWHIAYRPLAVLESETGSMVYLQGTAREVESQAARLGGEVSPGLDWPETPDGPIVLSLRVPPADVPEAVTRLPRGRFVAQHGVGEITFALAAAHEDLVALRAWAESRSGSMVVVGGESPSGFDPWGTLPPGLELQRRIMAAFDPAGILNPNRMPGGRTSGGR